MKLRRTMLYVPGNAPSMLRDAHIYGPDSVMFDLEDSVAPREKDTARNLVFQALRRFDYAGTERIVRINSLDTAHGQEDIAAVVAGGADGVQIGRAHG